ncbi:MAG: hypothetical protein KDK70_08605 [Myxococcales bacterium]|nr:hypothetical protein [Myxococcales bacterium]
MSIFNPLQKLLWTATLGGLATVGLGLGCVITVGPLDCSECGNTGCNSQQVGDKCLCDPGYEFANDDPNDFDCDRIPPKGGDANCGGESNVHLEGDVCVCDNGFNWCNPNDLDDLSCCPDDNQATSGVGTSDDTGTEEGTESADTTADETGDPPGMCEQVDAPWNGVEPDAGDCTEDGLVFCSNNDQEGPAGSRYWECLGGEWVESTTAGNESCQFDGFEFAYGCVDDGASVNFVCGVGPGTACSGPECDACAGDDVIEFCADGKLGSDSCSRICTEDGIDGITFDTGICVSDGGVADCFCCDEGDEGCPL